MAYIATVKIIVDEANEATVYDGLNEMLRTAQEPVFGGRLRKARFFQSGNRKDERS